MSPKERSSLAGSAPSENVVEEEEGGVGGLEVEGPSHSIEKQVFKGVMLNSNVTPTSDGDSESCPLAVVAHNVPDRVALNEDSLVLEEPWLHVNLHLGASHYILEDVIPDESIVAVEEEQSAQS